MKLTGWFSQDKIADNSRVQTPNNANTEQVNRQIRALVPGQALGPFEGEVVSKEGNNAAEPFCGVSWWMQNWMRISVWNWGRPLPLGEKYGQTLNLSPLFTLATEGTVRKVGMDRCR